MRKNNLIKKKYVEEYVDPLTGITGRELRLGYWWVTHKSILQRLGLICLALVDVVLILFATVGWGTYLFGGVAQQEKILRDLSASPATWPEWQASHSPSDLQVVSTGVFVGFDDKYDLAVEIANPNPEWLVFFDYRFVFRGGETSWRTSFLLPNESSIRGELGFDWQGRPREAQIEVQNIRWRRVNAHQIPNTEEFLKDRFNFLIRDAAVSSDSAQSLVRFTVRNASPYSYWRLPLYIGLYRAGRLDSVEYVALEKFLAQEERTINVVTTLFGGNVQDIRVYPELNVFDGSVYMPQ